MIENNEIKTEVLAPVGNFDMLHAAISAGAGAVYLAGKDFGARAYANNFSLDELKEIFMLCHFKGLKAYVTVNTLIKEEELEDAISFIDKIYLLGADAVIVQDMGLFSIIKDRYPSMEIHASTQISANNVLATSYLSELGFDRITLARETRLAEIERIYNETGACLEVFVHGSLCVSYSGKCLISSLIGTRSGNRGRCAQPCRKAYELVDSSMKALSKEAYFISPKDLALKEDARKLKEKGVFSFKIEGRMKKPEYVYSAVSYYKRLLDNRSTDDKILDEVSNRGFTKGFILGDFGKTYVNTDTSKKKGSLVGQLVKVKGKISLLCLSEINKGDSLEITLKTKKYLITAQESLSKGQVMKLDKFQDAIENSEVYRMSNALLREMNYLDMLKEDKLAVNFYLKARVGSQAELFCTCKDKSFVYKLEGSLQEAKTIGLDYKTCLDQLSKLGDSFFYLESLELDTDGRTFMAKSDLNELRRKAVGVLYEELSTDSSRKIDNFYKKKTSELKNPKKPTAISLFLEEIDFSLENEDRIKRIYLEKLEGIDDFNKKSKEIYFALSPVSSDKDLEAQKNYIDKYKKYLDGILINNIWEMDLKKDFPDLDFVCSIYTNVYNSETASYFTHLGASEVQLSIELDRTEIKNISDFTSCKKEIFVYGRPIEMLLEHCPASSMPGCDRNCKKCKYHKGHYLKTEFGDLYSFKRFGHLTAIEGSNPISYHEYMDKIQDLGLTSIMIKLDKRDNKKEIIDLFYGLLEGDYKNLKRPSDFRKGHFKRGIE